MGNGMGDGMGDRMGDKPPLTHPIFITIYHHPPTKIMNRKPNSDIPIGISPPFRGGLILLLSYLEFAI